MVAVLQARNSAWPSPLSGGGLAAKAATLRVAKANV